MSTTETQTRMLVCPHCGAVEGKVTLNAIADVTYADVVEAEVDLTDDLGDAGIGWDHRFSAIHPDERYMVTFRYGDTLERGDVIEHGNLRLDDKELLAFCWQCQGDVTEAFRALLEEIHPRAHVPEKRVGYAGRERGTIWRYFCRCGWDGQGAKEEDDARVEWRAHVEAVKGESDAQR